jgi:hypothetical protein
LENATGDAFLAIDRSFEELTSGGEASHFRAGSRSAGRSIVSPAGAKHKVSGVGDIAWSGKFDVVDFGSVFAGDSVANQRCLDRLSDVREFLASRQVDFEGRVVDDEEPVSAVSHVAGNFAVAVDPDGYILV